MGWSQQYNYECLLVLTLFSSSHIQADQQTAANHMYIAALAVAALAVAFAVGVTFTDRPPQPKSSQE